MSVPESSSPLCSSRCVSGNIVLLIQAFRRKFIIPEFDVFAHKINKIYDEVENNSDGKVSFFSFVPKVLSEEEHNEIKLKKA